MDTRKLEESSRLVGAISWTGIAAGAFLALAIQTVLLLFGRAVAGHDVGAGFAIWALLVELVSIGVGAALAASVTHPEQRAGGIAAGVMTWAVTIALGGLVHGLVMTRFDMGSAWAAFFGSLFALGAAVVGGRYGATIGSSSGGYVTPRTLGPERTQLPPHPAELPTPRSAEPALTR